MYKYEYETVSYTLDGWDRLVEMIIKLENIAQ